MSVDIVMPNLGFDTESGRLIEWLKQPGDEVAKGEILAVIESDKANVELESIAAGVLLEQLCQPGDEVAVGAVIARVGSLEAGSRPVSGGERRLSPVAQRMAQEHQLDIQQVQGSGARGRITRRDVEQHLLQAVPADQPLLALPKVRQAARRLGIRLADLRAAGAGSPIRLADLERYQQAAAPAVEAEAAAAPAEEPGSHSVSLSRIRQTVGRRMAESKREAPHFYVSGEFDLDDALRRLAALPAPQPGINDLIQYLTVQTLLRSPQLNATYHEGQLRRYDAVHLAIAVARDDGLITPVLPNAQQYSLSGLASVSRDLIRRARDNRLQAGDLQGGTFTISNLGMVQQVDHFTAVINPPQVAILAVGAAKPRPVVRAGGLHIRHTVHLTLSGDHRAVDGMDLARFMAAFQDELERFAG